MTSAMRSPGHGRGSAMPASTQMAPIGTSTASAA